MHISVSLFNVQCVIQLTSTNGVIITVTVMQNRTDQQTVWLKVSIKKQIKTMMGGIRNYFKNMH